VTIHSPNKVQLGQRVRRHVREQLYDESGERADGVAIYTLSDPRSIRNVRYVGQTRSPTRRFFQHMNTGRLWLPEEGVPMPNRRCASGVHVSSWTSMQRALRYSGGQYACKDMS
jgi:hypothetical protein